MYHIHRYHHYDRFSVERRYRKIDGPLCHPPEAGALSGLPIDYANYAAAAAAVRALESCEYELEFGEEFRPHFEIVQAY